MSLEIVPFHPTHLDGAAAVLAASHAGNLQREPMLPPRFTDVANARDVIEKSLPNSSGVVAIRDGRIVGYLSGHFGVDTLERLVYVQPSGSAIMPGEDTELYRLMYATAAVRWVASGYFSHYAQVASSDTDAVGAWFSLGFGQHSVYNWRDLNPVPGPETEISIRRVDAGAFDDAWTLRNGLRRYNAISPILHPCIWRIGEELQRSIDREKQMMADEKNAYFIGYRDGQPVSLMIFTPSESDYILTPDNSVYLAIAFVDEAARSGGIGAALVNRGLTWAHDQGYELCSVGYYSPNLLGARFWQDKGFQPIGYTLERRIDERIAWAKSEDI